jgi:hypothetical protein
VTRHTYTAARLRARDLHENDVILIFPDDDSLGAPQWRNVMDVWHDGDEPVAVAKYTYSDGLRDDEKIAFIRAHLTGLGSFVLVRYLVEKPDVAECETTLIALRSCDLVTVQQPEKPTALDQINWNDTQGLHAWVSGLPPRARNALDEILTALDTAENEEQILIAATAALTAHHPDRSAIGVVFTALDHEGRYFVGDSGTILFSDGTTTKMDFGIRMCELLTMEYGQTTDSFVVAVNLRDKRIDANDYGDEFDIHELLNPATDHAAE